ncbi:hypothetical protein BAUCODRAFT_247132 [Baudoinia panamericana UAMH 10762]|uniref:Uncharacterized protein n=1 Tax=Baudoinia panamericana (strain UAMH 10762) TaxID=717646 RepID=M2LHH6_BAUPA|nr:uncharacterized protein BAUCODRAFT_247132 [Baudoinia panamericana UAMH 10762]EMC93617.1 hypothetical protein BAUCODRAFT_247132 [Baudoinia panamericana UAMH 10762]
MATAVRNASNCRSSQSYTSDIPSTFNSNKTTLCGFSYPDPTGFRNLSSCWTGPVQVSNECFQYCEVVSTESETTWGYCVSLNTPNLTRPILTTCNSRVA